MIRLVRSVSLPSRGARRDFVGMRQPGFRAYAMRLEGMSYDANLLGTSNARNSFDTDLTAVLKGRWNDPREGGHELLAGFAARGPSAPTLSDRWNDGVVLITVEWDGPTSPYRVAPISERTMAAGHRFVEVLSAPHDRTNDVETLFGLLEALQADGFELPSVTVREPPEAAVRTAHMLNHALANLDQVPMWVDFTTERSERQWRRDLKQSNEWLGLLGGSFRHTLNSIRLIFAASLVTVPDITLREVAECLGYGSDRALLQAMRRAKMSPTKIRELALANERKRE